jgi:parallel beta-helix repeat protein
VRGRKIISIMVFCVMLLSVFLFYSEEAEATVDYIVIVDTAGTGGVEILDQTIDGGMTITGYAASFNTTSGYLGDVFVSWSVINMGTNATTNPSNGTTSDFFAGMSGGTATWEADDGLGHNDTVVLTVNPPTVDFIKINDAPGLMGSEMFDQTVNVGFTTWGYAAGYNNTIGYIGGMTATWSVTNFGGASSFTSPGTGTSSQFNADTNPGSATWTADFAGNTDTVDFTINTTNIDYIQIRTGAGGGGIDLCDPGNYPTYSVGHNTTFYGAGYNYTLGYVGNVPTSSTWVSSNDSLVSVTSNGTFSLIQCSYTDEGTATITLNDTLGHTNTTQVTVVIPTIDYIKIRDSNNGKGNIVNDMLYILGDADLFWAAGFNHTYGYIEDVTVTWSSNDTGVGTVTTPGSFTTFNTQGSGTCTVTADYGGGISNTTGILTVSTVDYIVIEDAVGLEVGDDFMNIGGNGSYLFAYGYNNTLGKLLNVTVLWESSNTTVGQVMPSGSQTSFNASTDGTCIVTADYGGLTDETGTITVSSYNVDYIQIRDAPGGGGNVVDNPEYLKESVDTYYGAMYNTVEGYLANASYDSTWYSWDTNLVTVTSPGTSSTITCSDTNSGMVQINMYAHGRSANATITVLDWTIDYIRIDDAQSGLGNVIGGRTYGVYETDIYYAVGYNFTHGYVMDISASWSSDDDTVGTVTTPGESTTFTAQWVASDSTCQVTASWDIFSNTTGVLTVLTPTVDFVQIRDAPNGGGGIISSISYYNGDTDTFYGASYNNTVAYIGPVVSTSTWVSSDDKIVEVTSPGNLSSITCNDTNSGTVTITLNNGMGQINSTSVTVLEFTVDYILIRDAPLGGGNDLTDPVNYPEFPVGYKATFYGAMYNNSEGYIADVASTSTWVSSDPDIADASSPGVFSSITCSDTEYGTVIITLEEWMGHTAQTEVTVLEPTIDFMKILDAPDGEGDVVEDMEYQVLNSDYFYAASYNFTAGFLYDISVNWSSNNTDVGTVTSPGTQTEFTAEGEGICIVSADYGYGISNSTGTITVLRPTNLTVDDDGDAMFETIQEAIDYAQDGDTILVSPGTYYEHLTIDKSISLVGENKENTIIDGEGYVKVIYVSGDNVSISGFTIQNGNYTIYLDESDATTITDCIIKDYVYGIYNYKTTAAYIAYNKITQGEFGIVTFEAYNDAIRYNIITYNTEYGAKDYNSQLENCFNWNTFRYNKIGYYYDPDVDLSTLEFDGNVMEDNEIAIKVENASTISITNNTLSGNEYGIVLTNASPVIALNSISISDFGIFAEHSSPTIADNVIGEISRYGIYARFAESLRIINNTLSDSEIIVYDSTIKELRLTDSTITQINTSSEIVQMDDTSSVDVKWLLHIRVVDDKGDPIVDAAVLVYNAFDDLVSAYVTDSEGWIEEIDVLETLQSGSMTTHYNPYKIIVIKDSKRDTREISIDEDTTISIAFEGKEKTTQSAGVSMMWAYVLLIGFIGAIGIGGIFIEVFKYGLLVIFIPLYSRLKKQKLLDQPTRYKIYGYIIGNPGAYFGLIKEELELGNGQLVYHLKQLEDAHMIYSREDGPKKRFYPSDIPRAKEGSSNISSIQDKILGVIKNNSGIGQKKIASEMGISRQVAGYHLTKMERKGLIDKEVKGRETRYYSSEKQAA